MSLDEQHCCGHDDHSQKVRDPVCGMMVTPDSPYRHAGHGEKHYFCSALCLETFVSNASALTSGPEQPDYQYSAAATFTCPMHPEIESPGPGTCPLCGMALEPRTIELGDNENAELDDMTRRFWFAAVLSLPLVAIVMIDMLPGSPVSNLLPGRSRGFIELALATPVCLWSAWPFYERAP